MRFESSLVAQLPLAGALEAAARRPGDFFPSRIGFAAALRSPKFLPTLGAELKADYRVSDAQSAQVPKWGGATRPAIDLAVIDRVVLDSLVGHLRKAVVPGLVNWSPRGVDRRMTEREIAGADSEYVFMTDAAAFYEYVDHDVLADELLDLTGEDVAVEALTFCLSELMHAKRGLPQGPISVGDLADIYLSVVDRRLVRDGLTIYRFTDDYRIPVASWEAARDTQLRIERYLRDVGLVINVGKTISPKHSRYVQWELEQRARWFDELAQAVDSVVEESDEEEAEPDETEADFTDEYDQPQLGLRDLADTTRLVARIERDLDDELSEPPFWGTQENVRQSKRIRPAIAVLASAHSTKMLAHLPTLLRDYPHLTMEVALALRDLASNQATCGPVLESVQAVALQPGKLFEWQIGWLLHALVTATDRLPNPLAEWVMAELRRESAPWFVRGRAAAVLATEGTLPFGDDFSRMLEECPRATLPDFVGAAALSGTAPGMRVVKSQRDPICQGIPAALEELGKSWL